MQLSNGQTLPDGSKVLIYRGPDGMCYQTGAAVLPNGQTCQCQKNPNWVPSAPNRYNRNSYAMVSSEAAAQIQQQIANGAPGVGNTFQSVDIPGRGPVGISRLEGNGSPVGGGGLVYQLILNNIAIGAGGASARQFIGDYVGTYVLLGNTEVSPAGFVVGGSWGTNSKTQFAGRTMVRPWRVKNIQFIATDDTFYNLTQTYYFDTKPTPNSPTKDSLTLTNLLTGNQYNPKIQWYDQPIRFDGINGLDILIPGGQSVTLQFNIESESSAGDQVLLT